jgi:hypothetical protein
MDKKQVIAEIDAATARGITSDALVCLDTGLSQELHGRTRIKVVDLLSALESQDDQDMADVGRALMETINSNSRHGELKGWAPTNCPSEVVTDLLNRIDELKGACPSEDVAWYAVTDADWAWDAVDGNGAGPMMVLASSAAEAAKTAIERWSSQGDSFDMKIARLTLTGFVGAEKHAGGTLVFEVFRPAEPATFDRLSHATADVIAERRRQIQAEGWTPEHDDEHAGGELAQAAAYYALHSTGRFNDIRLWPWSPDWFKPTDRRRDLVKAAAMIIAEIERLDRAAAMPEEG